MSFELTEEQRMIQNMVREFSRGVVAPTAAERDRTKEFPADNLKKMGELGLMGMMVPPEYGGSGCVRCSKLQKQQSFSHLKSCHQQDAL